MRKLWDSTTEGRAKWLLIVSVSVVLLAGCANTESSGSSSESGLSFGVHSSSSASSQAGEEHSGNNPAKNASESNTPRVGSGGSVEVDDLRWRVLGAHTAHVIGEPQAGGATANGVFVIVDLSVMNHKSASVTLADNTMSLVASGKVYEVNINGETSLPGKSISLQEIGPNVTAQGETVFDVAPEVLHEQPELRFNELGLGSTHGYIALPSLEG